MSDVWKRYLFTNAVMHAQHMCMKITQYTAVIRVAIIEHGVCNIEMQNECMFCQDTFCCYHWKRNGEIGNEKWHTRNPLFLMDRIGN